MIRTPVPNTRTPAKVPIGSLVYIQSAAKWALRTADGYYDLSTSNRGQVDGLVADYGQFYRFFVDPASASSLSHPWQIPEPRAGDLAVFEDNQKLLVLGFDARADALVTLDPGSGKKVYATSDNGGALSYQRWYLAVRDEDDETWVTVYSHGPEDT